MTTHDQRHATHGILGRAILWRPLPPLAHLQSPIANLSGFTLIEMLIVISIISVLLGLLYGALERAQKFSRRTITFSELKSIESSFKQYHAHYHTWPTNAVALNPIKSGEDQGFVIDNTIAKLLQGLRDNNASAEAIQFNPEAVPFMEFSRYSPVTRYPVNPFKSEKNTADDISRCYWVLFDSNGDRSITIPIDAQNAPGTTSPTNIIASVAVWTVIPATRQTDNSGQAEKVGDVIFGCWDSFSVK